MIFFTGCTHFGDTRLDLMNFPFQTVNEAAATMRFRMESLLTKDDILFHLGDVVVEKDYNQNIQWLDYFKRLPCRKILIRGNYDLLDDQDYIRYGGFESVHNSYLLRGNNYQFFLTHKPEDASCNYFNIISHVHSALKIQRNMLNVGAPIWNFRPVSMEKVLFTYNSIKTYFDINAFAAELPQNQNGTQ